MEDSLLDSFGGQKLTMGAIYAKHSVGKPYVKGNYKKALTNLEAVGKIEAAPSADNRPNRRGQVTFGDQVVVMFPRRVRK